MFTACAHKSLYDIPPEIAEDGKFTYDQFVSAHTFPYIAPEERQRQLRQNYSQLSIGLTKTEVSVILGEPDYSKMLYSKGPTPWRFMGSSWNYFFEKPDPIGTNIKTDKNIHVFFGADGKTKRITTNIEGLYEIVKPERENSQQNTTADGGE